MKRKAFLGNTAAIFGAALLPDLPLPNEEARKKPLRFAYLTDIHVKPGIIPETGMARALQKAQQLSPAVQFIFNGGDSIMDSLEADKVRTRTQWDLFKKILNNENSLPVQHVIGNHDIWGWFLKKDRPETDPLYGKHWVLEELSMPQRFYSFTKGKWRFIVLDSVQLNPEGGYIGRLDEEQVQWLTTELSAVPKGQFVCMVSHVPILSICAGLFFGKTEANGDLLIKRNLMHTDFLALKKLFLANPNIKVCLSGHIHLQDEVDYLGVKYYCNGAVSGNWWGGSFQEFDPAFAVIELYDDGSSKRTMIKY